MSSKPSIKQVQKIGDKINVRITKVRHSENEYFANRFPNKMNIPFIEYIKTHFKIVEQDNYSITFRI